jgi:Flp pilus assembly protein TadB
MGLYVNQKNDRSELQDRVAAELREKARQRANLEDVDRPDGVSDSEYMKDIKQNTTSGWVWAVAALVAIVVVSYVVVSGS